MSTIFEPQALKLQDESPIHGDLLEAVFAHVPLVDLARASRVSRAWEGAVASSLLHLNRARPWLVVHAQGTRAPGRKTVRAYDPRSRMWVEIGVGPASAGRNEIITERSSALRSSNSTLLYEISPNGLSFSVDPVHVAWRHVPPPRVWRVDPIVALVGAHVIVAGGGSWFEDDPLSVEVYDLESSHWSTCQSMPEILKDSAASTWLSVAANQDKMYVTEKASGFTYSFSPKAKKWSGPYDARPEPGVIFSAVGFAGEDLVLAGIIGDAQNISALKIWKIKPELMEFEQIGEIPLELMEKLKGESSDLSSISLMAAKDFLYIYNNSDPSEIIFSELVGGSWKWGSVENIALTDERKIGERMVMSCGTVGIQDLHMAMKLGNLKFLVKSFE